MNGAPARSLFESEESERLDPALVLVPAWEHPSQARAPRTAASSGHEALRLARWLARVLGITLALYLTAVPEALPAPAPAGRPAKKTSRPATKPGATPALPAPDSAARTRQAWTEARRLADQGRHDEALRMIHEGLRQSPEDVELLWLEAGVHGWAGRHREAVVLYERLVQRHPEMAKEVRNDLAEQRLESGDAAGAVSELDLRIAEAPEDREARVKRALALARAGRLPESLAAYDRLLAETPDDVDLALERARVLAWLGRHDKAIAAYQEILRAHPDEARARLGLAQNENWRGNHRRAAARYEEMLAAASKDPEVRKGLAFAYYWAGRSERAREALGAYLALEPDDPEAIELAALLARERRPTVTVGYARADDSDALRVQTRTAELHLPVGRASGLSALWRRDDVHDGGGAWRPERFGAGAEHAWSERWSARASLARLDPGQGLATVGVGEASATWRPADRLRLDLGVARDVVLTRLSLDLGLRSSVVVVGMDWQARDRLMVRAAQRIAFMSDDNRVARTSASFSADALTERRFRLALGAGIERLAAEDDLDHGYYDPESYVEFGPVAHAEWRPGERSRVGFVGKVGMQHEGDGENDPFTAYTVTAELPLGNALALNFEAGRSNSNLSSASGYEQKRWAAYFTAWF